MTVKTVRIIKLLICIILITAVSCISSYYNARERLTYCKNVYLSGDNVYLLSEKGILDSVLFINSDKKIEGRASILNTNYFTGKVRNFKYIIDDDQGNIYLVCTAYSDSEGLADEIYRCNFELGIMQKIAQITPPDGLSSVDGAMYRIYDGKIYGVFKNESVSVLEAFVYDEDRIVMLDVSAKIQNFVDRCFYTPEGIAALSMKSGVWLNDKEICTVEDTSSDIFNGLNFKDGKLCFVNMGSSVIYCYDTVSGLTEERISKKSYEKYQSSYVYPDFTISACYENDDGLSAIVSTSDYDTQYSRLNGDISAVTFIRSAVVTLIIILLINGIYILLFVRRKKAQSGKDSVRFVGVTSKILAVSLTICIAFSVVFGNIIYQKIDELNQLWHRSDKITAASSLDSLTILNLRYDATIDKIIIPQDRYDDFRDEVEKIKQLSFDSKTKTTYSLVGISEYNGEMICIYSDEFYGMADAKYAVSSELLEMCRRAFEDESDMYSTQSFEDKRSIGLMNTIIRTIKLDGVTANIAFCVISNGYADRLDMLSILPLIIGAVMLICIVFITIAGIILKIMFGRIKKLTYGIERYTAQKDSSGLLVSGRDEIADAGEALSLMAKSIDIYAADISEGNKNYSRLISHGILELIGQPDISRLEIGQRNRVQGYVVRFAANDLKPSVFDSSSRLACKSGGCILDFTKYRLDIFFPAGSSARAIAEECFDICTQNKVSAYISYGTVYAGRVGDRNTARLAVLCSEYSLFDRMYDIEKAGGNVLLHISLYEKLKGGMVDFKFRIIENGSKCGYFQLLKIDRENPDLRLKTLKSFSNALKLFEAKNYRKSFRIFKKISQMDNGDLYAGYYLTETQRKLRLEN